MISQPCLVLLEVHQHLPRVILATTSGTVGSLTAVASARATATARERERQEARKQVAAYRRLTSPSCISKCLPQFRLRIVVSAAEAQVRAEVGLAIRSTTWRDRQTLGWPREQAWARVRGQVSR